MDTDELLNIIDDHLQELNHDDEKRALRIKDIMAYLNYNLRLTELSKEEKENFVASMEGDSASPEMKKKIDECKTKSTEKEFDHYIEMWARSTYFRKCHWLHYLHGKTDEKPFISK